MRRVQRLHVEWLWNLTTRMNVLHPDNWTSEAQFVFDSYMQEVFIATKKDGWNGHEEGDPQWSFAGSLLFSVTVITTIGYGHIAPRTDLGRLATMIYAIFGIPLTLFTVANLGSIMATAFRFIYKFVCCGLCCLCCRSRAAHAHPSRVTSKISRQSVLSVGGGKGARRRDGIKRRRSIGSVKSGVSPGRLQRLGSDQQFESSKEMKSGETKQSTVDSVLTIPADDVGWQRGRFETWRLQLTSVFTEQSSIDKISVPIYVSLLLMSSYILLGAFLFYMSEGWEPLVAAYFCFITLSTIGFGDYVPGTSLDSWRSQKTIVCALYLFCGLSLMAMCFDLMQEEAKNKFRRLGRRLGLLKDDTSAL